MKKTLIAIAALVATGAFAQSTVTIGGQLDAGYSTQKSDTVIPAAAANTSFTFDPKTGLAVGNAATPATKVTNSSNGISGGNYGASRVFFTGSEDLGGGMKANFRLEMQPNMATGGTGGVLFNRGAWLGLSGGFGEVKLGKQGTSTAGLICGVIDLNGCYGSFFGGGILFAGNGGTPGQQGSAMFQANAQNATGTGANLSPAANTDSTRYDRAITYTTAPLVAGLTATVDYAFNGTATPAAGTNTVTTVSGGAGKTTAVGLTYSAGPLSAGFNTQRADSSTTGTVTASTNTFGGKYNLGAAIVSFGFQKGATATGGATSGDSKALTLGAKFPMGAMSPYIVMNRGSVTNTTSGVTSDIYVSKILNVGTTYALSKRTDVYADMARDGGSNGQGAANYGVNASIMSIGLRHNF